MKMDFVDSLKYLRLLTSLLVMYLELLKKKIFSAQELLIEIQMAAGN